MNRTLSERALVLAPLGRDAQVACAMLQEVQIDTAMCENVETLASELLSGAGFAVVTEESVRNRDLRSLVGALHRQEEWSDFPFILLTQRGGGIERNPAAQRLLETLGNVTFLERPFHPTTLMSLARAALRSRLRQYEARSRLTAIREGEEELHIALAAGQLGSWALDLIIGQLTASATCKAHFGRTPDEPFSYEDLLASVYPEDSERMQASVGECIAKGSDCDIEYRCVWPDGSIHWLEMRARPRRDIHGEPVRLTGVSRDVTHRKLHEEALEASERQFRTLADSIPTLCWMARPDGTIFWYNSRWFDYTGTTLQEMDGWGWQRVHDPDVLPEVIDRWKRSLETGLPFEMTFPLRAADGSYRPFLTRVLPVRDETGEIVRWFGTNTDVWSQQQAENALRNVASELERRVEERTHDRELALAQLHEAQKLETVGQLTGGVAHDFNNLLTPILGGLDMLRRMHDDSRSQRLIGNALQAAERARTLISRLLAFARRQNLEARPVDAASLLRGMFDLIQRSLGPQIEIRLLTSEPVAAAMVDPNQLELAILNLAVNARDAMPGGGTLTLAVSEEEAAETPLPAGRYVRITAADTGVGMDANTLQRAIEPFYSTKGTGKGTGLGLSMVDGLAAQSGGVLRLRSQPGAGTTAELWLPVASAPIQQVIAASPDVVQRGTPLSVLLVDDEELVRLGTAEMLADLGHEVTQATSGPAALALVRSAEFDLLVSDYLMPGMNGLDLIAEARQVKRGLSALLITGFADLPDGVESRTVMLAKPFNQSELAHAILKARRNFSETENSLPRSGRSSGEVMEIPRGNRFRGGSA